MEVSSGRVVKRLVAPTVYSVMNDVASIDVDTSSGGTTIIKLQPIDISEVRKHLYINDISNNASVGNIIIQCSGGNLINNAPSLILNSNGIIADIEVADRSRFIANLNNDEPTPPLNDKNFVYQQTVNSVSWNVPYNLGKRCAVQVLDNNFDEIEAKIHWVSDNEVIVTLNKPQMGWVYCN